MFLINEVFVESNSIYIYRSGLADYKTLTSKKENAPVWLLRESTQPGMLTVDYLYFKDNAWKGNSKRFLLSEKGWIVANQLNDPEVKKAISSMKSLDSQTAGSYVSQLDECIASQQFLGLSTIGLDQNLRINPKKEEQTTNKIYSNYTCDVTSVNLSQSGSLAITCPMTMKTMMDPVVYKLNGVSFEKRADANTDLYIPNIVLKDIIKYLGLKDVNMIEEALLDPISSEPLTKPVILPNGSSVNESTWEKLKECPYSRKPLGEMIPNNNLRVFIEEWPLCKDTLLSKDSREL